MECQHSVKSLVVLTLLQLCRAEIKDSEPQWYSANIINDVFQPKSISELFTTEPPTFSTANPIVVSSSIFPDGVNLLSTLAPPTSLSSSTLELSSSTTPSPPSSQSIPPTPNQYQPPINKDQIRLTQIDDPVDEIQLLPVDYESIRPSYPLVKIVSELQSQTQRNVQIQEQSTTAQPLTPSSPVTATTFYETPPTEIRQTQETQFVISQDPQTSFRPSPSTQQPIQSAPQQQTQNLPPSLSQNLVPILPQNLPPHPNYFLIYQQAPQSIQGYPFPSSSPQTPAGGGSSTASPISSTFPTTFTSVPPTLSTVRTVPIPIRTSPVFSSTSIQTQQPQLTAVTVTPSSTIGSSSLRTSAAPVNCVTPTVQNPNVPINAVFPLKIRVVAPSGSITNVNLNTRIQPTTQRTTTTRRPTTRRTPKPRRNTYDRCLQGCRKNGQNLCAGPLSQTSIDPSTLRGFPSVCHMACHNSYRKNPYEKIVDGSCSRLRTRIRPVDSNSKLNRDELNKGQYFIDNSQPPAIVEFTGGYA